MIFSRVWAMPNPDTFSIKPIAELLSRYVSGVTVDPFARNSKLATYTNDLNPETTADSHMEAVLWLDKLIQEGVQADCCLLDPPYSPRQISEVYKSIGLKASQLDTQNARLYKECKDRMNMLLKQGGVAITCGWNSMGFGINRGYEMIELLLVPCGAAHNDYIVTVERKK